MSDARVVPFVAKCAVLCAVLMIAGCEEQATPVTPVASIICTDGTLNSPLSPARGGVACVPYSCSNGTAALGTTIDYEDAERCAACGFGYILNVTERCRPVLVAVDSVSDVDDGDYELDGAVSVATAVVGGATYLFVAGKNDYGVSVFSVGDDGGLASVANVSDDAELELAGATSVAVAVVGNATYLFVAGIIDGGVSVFSVGDDGGLVSVANVSDDDDLALGSASAVAVAAVGGATYLFVSGFNEGGVSVFLVGVDGALDPMDTVIDADDADLELEGAISVAAAAVGSATYLFVAGQNDHGVSVFSVGSGGMLASVANVSDDADLELRGASSVAAAAVGNATYLFVAGFADDGVSVFSVGSDGALASVDNVTDDGELGLNGAASVATAAIEGTAYLFVAGRLESRVSVFSVGSGGVLASVANIGDTADLKLSDASAVTTAVVGGFTYLFVAGNADDGVSVFAVGK